MSGKVENFDRRLGRVTRKHRAMSRGYSFRVQNNGLISVIPKHSHAGFPFRSLVLVLAIGLLFKGVVLANYGPEKYNSKVAMLQSGTIVEQVGAWLLRPSKTTRFIASKVDGFLR